MTSSAISPQPVSERMLAISRRFFRWLTEPEQIERGKQALIDDDFNVAFFEGISETLNTLNRQGFLLAIRT